MIPVDTPNREQYVADLKVQLDRLNAEILRMAEKDAAAKELESLRAERERALTKLRQLS